MSRLCELENKVDGLCDSDAAQNASIKTLEGCVAQLKDCEIVTTSGVVERIWGPTAVAHGNPSGIFNGPTDPSTGLPTHVSGPADVETIVADAVDSANQVGGGGAGSGTHQAEWFWWVNIPAGGAAFQDVNQNTGERIRYWTAPLCANPIEIGEVTVNTGTNDRDFGPLGSYGEGWRFFGKQLSDLSANSGVQLQWDLNDGNGFVNVPASAFSATQPYVDSFLNKLPKAILPAVIPAATAPTVQRTVSNLSVDDYGGNWLWGGWTPVITETTGVVDLGWEEAFSVTAPAFDPASPVTLYDAEINAKFGRYQTQAREANLQSWLGWRVLVNGLVVGTRATAEFLVRDTRTNLGTETLARVQSTSGGSWHWVRDGVPAGATVSVEYQHRYRVVNVQDNAWARFLVGATRDATFDFTPRTIITDVS